MYIREPGVQVLFCADLKDAKHLCALVVAEELHVGVQVVTM